MKKTKHTPGPWIVDFDIPATFEDRTENVFEIMKEDRSTTTAYATSLADAALIAAAPDLLADAVAFLAFFRQFNGPEIWKEINEPGSCPSLANLQATIAKATEGT